MTLEAAEGKCAAMKKIIATVMGAPVVTGIQLGTPALARLHGQSEIHLNLPLNPLMNQLKMGEHKAIASNLPGNWVAYTPNITACIGIILASFTVPGPVFHGYYFAHVAGGNFDWGEGRSQKQGMLAFIAKENHHGRQVYGVAASGGQGISGARINKGVLIDELGLAKHNTAAYVNGQGQIHLGFVPATGEWGEIANAVLFPARVRRNKGCCAVM